MQSDQTRRAAKLKAIAERIKQARKAKGLTQVEVADLIGVARSSYATLEQGKHARPEDYTLALANTLDVEQSWLTLEDEPFIFEARAPSAPSDAEEGFYVDQGEFNAIMDCESWTELQEHVAVYRDFHDPKEVHLLVPDVFVGLGPQYRRVTPKEAMSMVMRMQNLLSDYATRLAEDPDL